MGKSSLSPGYDSVKLLENSGVFVTLWVALACVALFALLFKTVFRCECPRRCSNRILKGIVWNPVLRALIETFLELGICSFVNILNVIRF